MVDRDALTYFLLGGFLAAVSSGGMREEVNDPIYRAKTNRACPMRRNIPEAKEILDKWLDQGSEWLITLQNWDIVPLYRRRESVTALEVIAKMREMPWPQHARTFSEAAIQMIELTITEICNPEAKGSE